MKSPFFSGVRRGQCEVSEEETHTYSRVLESKCVIWIGSVVMQNLLPFSQHPRLSLETAHIIDIEEGTGKGEVIERHTGDRERKERERGRAREREET